MQALRAVLPLAFSGAALALPGTSQGERYDVTRTMLPPQNVATRAVVVLDLDGNGRPDLYLVGGKRGRLYRNDGTGVFRDESWRLPNVSFPGLGGAAGDLDGDGSADLVVGTSAGSDRLYLNQGAIFADASGALPSDPSPTYAVALGDVDGDGDLDVWLGNDAAPSRLFLNDGSAGFTDASGQIPSAVESVTDVALGDVDGDGDLDAVIAVGRSCSAASLQDRLYLNDGAGTFTDATDRLPADQEPTTSVVLGDVDGDLDLDVVLGVSDACDSYGAPNRLYKNDGSGTFADATAQLPPVWDNTRACALGDVDGDGDLDVVFGNSSLTLYYGPVEGSGVNRLCLNDGAGVFHAAPLLPIKLDEGTSSIALVDVDGDGDPDVLVGNAYTDRLHLNDGNGSFAAVEVVLPHDSMKAVGMGDVDDDGDLDAVYVSRFYSSIPFSQPEFRQRLFLGDGAGYFLEDSDKLPGIKRYAADAVFGDVDGDGDTDILLVCPYDGEMFPLTQDNLLYLNDGTGTFSDATDQLPTFLGDDRGVAVSGMLVDVDGDGDLDAIIAESDDYDGGGGGVTLFSNDGSGVFADATSQVGYLGWGGTSHFQAGDVDGDGDVDLVAGKEPGWIYLMQNDGAGHFTDATAQMPPLLEVGHTTHLGLGDVDGDQDLDLVVGFFDWAVQAERNLLYTNDGSGFFTDESDRIPQLLDDYLLADVDDDGDLDLLGASKLLLNDGGGAFALVTGQLPAGLHGPRELGDVDGDGDLDALVAPGAFWSYLPPTGQNVVWSNLTRHLAWRGLPRVGKPLALDVYGPAGTPWLLAWAPAAEALALPPFGTLWLPPALLAPVGSGALDAAGRATAWFAVPADPGLVGVALHWQALVGWPLRFTNREVTLFSDL